MRLEWKRKTLWASMLLGGAAGLALAVLWFFQPARHKPQPAGQASVEQGPEEFFRLYWQRPVPPQGDPPRSFTATEAELSPEACGSCHAQQFMDWKESLHSKAMGPGPWGQIIDIEKNSPKEAVLCMTCHGPLSEQIPFIAGDGHPKNPGFDRKLQLVGITCAACHLRGYRHFGPPKDEKSPAVSYPAGTPNHGGVQRTPYFERAEFCKDCHQFDPENTILVNGKPLQDTYREWQNSSWGQGGAACQACHMPGRRHLWKGIHDSEWVRNSVRASAAFDGGSASGSGQPAKVTVEVTNAAVGHKFPTYITPKVFVRAALLDRAGKSLAGSLQEKIIGWDARFEGGQWREHFDTRIPPGETFRATFQWAFNDRARQVRAWIEIYPDHFYRVHFYPAYLAGQALSREGRRLIEKAVEESGRTPYILFEKLIPLP